MRNRGAWIAFLSTCFALTGLVGLFASYGAAIPLERALRREEALDAALAGPAPDRAELQALIGPEASAALLAPGGDAAARSRAARAKLREEGLAEQAAVASRTRLMVVIVTLLCGLVGVGVLLIATRPVVTEG